MSKSLFPGVALVTGASSGIGRATALAFAREGCKRICIADRLQTSLPDTAQAIIQIDPSIEVEAVFTDINYEGDIVNLLSRIINDFGRLDYAVNCAGVLGAAKKSHEMSLEEFDKVVNVDYRGTWLCSREELKQMVKQVPLPTHDGRPGNRGSIVNIASQLGIVARPQAPAYCSAKAAVIGFTRSDAIDYSQHNIRINCVCPGVIETPMINDKVRDAVAIAPMNRPGTPEEIADCVLFLCSPKASFVQGAALVADGGYTIN